MKRVLIILAVAFLSCEKEPTITENKPDFYYGSCKVKLLDTKGNYTGVQYLIYNESETPEGQFEFIDSCEAVGGYYVHNNDSNGRMCYTCTITDKWFPN